MNTIPQDLISRYAALKGSRHYGEILAIENDLMSYPGGLDVVSTRHARDKDDPAGHAKELPLFPEVRRLVRAIWPDDSRRPNGGREIRIWLNGKLGVDVPNGGVREVSEQWLPLLRVRAAELGLLP